MNDIPVALREARDRVAARIRYEMPGCEVPDCPACRNIQRRATALATEAVMAGMRWHMYDAECWEDAEAILAALEQDREGT